jgi:hypothetical protein
MDKRLVALALGSFVVITGPAYAVTRTAVPVPTVQTPQVPALPDVPVPVPTVVVPPLPVPIPLPPVVAPSVPVPVPTVVTQAAPASPRSAPGGATSRTTASGSSGTGAPGGGASGAGAPGGGASGTGASGRGTSGTGASGSGDDVAATGRGSAGAARADAHRARVRERRLRRAVRRLRGCLPELPRLEARVLRLRAGIGRGGPRSVRRVARIIGRTERRVVRIERRGLRRLRAAARDGCVPQPMAAGAAASTADGGTGTSVLASQPATGVAEPSSASARGEVLGAHAQHNPAKRRASTRLPSASTFVGPVRDHPSFLLPLLLAFAAAAWLLARYIHRRAAAPADFVDLETLLGPRTKGTGTSADDRPDDSRRT